MNRTNPSEFILFWRVVSNQLCPFRLVLIDHGVTTGPHFVECQLLGEDGQQVEPFKLLGIFAT